MLHFSLALHKKLCSRPSMFRHPTVSTPCSTYMAAVLWAPVHSQGTNSDLSDEPISRILTLILPKELILKKEELNFCYSRRHTHVSSHPSTLCPIGYKTQSVLPALLRHRARALKVIETVSSVCFWFASSCRLGPVNTCHYRMYHR